MQSKPDLQFEFFIRIPHDFPFGYLRCSIPRDAETLNLDYFDILEVSVVYFGVIPMFNGIFILAH